jgi:hypothetical protein
MWNIFRDFKEVSGGACTEYYQNVGFFDENVVERLVEIPRTLGMTVGTCTERLINSVL